MNSLRDIGGPTMPDAQPANLEQDHRFPSGAWTGFFLQCWLPGRNTMDLDLSFRTGDLMGEGRGRVGAFTIDGSYDVADGNCRWIKPSVGMHPVAYRGMNDGHGIWGVWEIHLPGGLYTDRGGFHIWPDETHVSEESHTTERPVLAMMRKQIGSPLCRIERFFLILGMLVALAPLSARLDYLIRASCDPDEWR